MVVLIHDGAARLEQLDDLKSFKVVAPAGATISELAAALAEAGRMDGDVAWISETWLRAEASGRDVSWFAAFDDMLAYAASKGWRDEETGSVRAHLDRR